MGIVIRVDHIDQGKTEENVFAKNFFQNEVTLGRLTANDIVLSEPDVSGKHAKLLLKNTEGKGSPRLCIVDLKSSNGTFVEETRIPADEPYELGEKQRIVIGRFVVHAMIEAPEPKQVSSVNEEEQPGPPVFQTAARKAPEEVSISLETLLETNDLLAIYIDAADAIYVRTPEGVSRTSLSFPDEKALSEALRLLVVKDEAGHFDTSPGPLHLTTGQLLHTLRSPFISPAFTAKITKNEETEPTPASLEESSRRGMLSLEMCEFISEALNLRKNILIIGDTCQGAGELFRGLLTKVPAGRRVCVIQSGDRDLPEREPALVISLPPAGGMGRSPERRDLVLQAASLQTDHNILSVNARDLVEIVRSNIAAPLKGVIAQIAGSSFTGALLSLYDEMLEEGTNVPFSFLTQMFARSFSLLIQLETCGSAHKITAISEITGALTEGGDVERKNIFLLEQRINSVRRVGRRDSTGDVPEQSPHSDGHAARTKKRARK